MDLISKPVIELTTLALDGLSARHKVLSSNIANADTPGFKRSDVSFNDQLSKIISRDNAAQKEKEDYSASLMYYPNTIISSEPGASTNSNSSSQSKFIDTDNNNVTYDTFQPEVMQTNEANIKPDGNNISIEHEMAELTQNGMKYTALTTLQQKEITGILDAIKGGGM